MAFRGNRSRQRRVNPAPPQRQDHKGAPHARQADTLASFTREAAARWFARLAPSTRSCSVANRRAAGPKARWFRPVRIGRGGACNDT